MRIVEYTIIMVAVSSPKQGAKRKEVKAILEKWGRQVCIKRLFLIWTARFWIRLTI